MEDHYRRVIIGMGWPGARQGAAVRIGVHKTFDRVRKGYPVDVLEESFVWDPATLVKIAVAMDRKTRSDAVAVDLKEEGLRRIIDDEVERSRWDRFPVVQGVFCDPPQFPYLVSTLRRLLAQGLVKFTPESEIPALGQELRPDEVATAKLTDFPVLTALALAVCEGDVETDEQDRPAQEYADTPEDILS